MTSASNKSKIITADSKKIDKKKVDKAFDSFVNSFNIDDLPDANKQVYDLLEVAQFNAREEAQFLERIKRHLSSKKVSLNILK